MAAESDEDEGTPAGDRAGAEQPGVGRFLYRLALAGVGGLMLAQEEIAGMLRREREGEGSDPEQDAAAEAEEARVEGEAGDRVDHTITKVLRGLSVPSRVEVDALREAVDALEEQVEALRARAGGGAA